MVLLRCQSLDFERGWPRKQLHTQLLSGVGSSPPAAHRASFEVKENSILVYSVVFYSCCGGNSQVVLLSLYLEQGMMSPLVQSPPCWWILSPLLVWWRWLGFLWSCSGKLMRGISEEQVNLYQNQSPSACPDSSIAFSHQSR